MPWHIKDHGQPFDTRLHAHWAAFFELTGWSWQYRPVADPRWRWKPIFWVSFPCGHSECPPEHELLVAVLPLDKNEDFDGHPCTQFTWGSTDDGRSIPADGAAAFGKHPHISHWVMSHGAGGGEEDVSNWVRGDVDELWQEASQQVYYLTPA